jgi:hypothetical protein
MKTAAILYWPQIFAVKEVSAYVQQQHFL